MPNCRHCGARIEKFNKDRCPVCGELNPLDGVSSETVEITSQLDKKSVEYKRLKVRTKKTLLIYACLLGWTGAHFFYIKTIKPAFIWLFCNLLVIGLMFTLLFFFKLPLWVCFLVSFAFIYFANIMFGVSIYRHAQYLKDGNGNLVR